MTIKEVLAARTAPGTWHTYEYDSRIGHHTGVREGSGTDLSTSRGIEDARAIVAMDHIIDPALAVVEAAREHACDTPYGDDGSRELHEVVAAFDAAVEEVIRP